MRMEKKHCEDDFHPTYLKVFWGPGFAEHPLRAVSLGCWPWCQLLYQSPSYCGKHQDQGNLKKGEFMWVHSFRGWGFAMAETHGRKHQAWWLKQEVESSHPELQSWSRESKLQLAEVFQFSKPAPDDDFQQQGHTSQIFPTAPAKNQEFKYPRQWEHLLQAPQHLNQNIQKSLEGKCLRSWGPRRMEIAHNGRNYTNILKSSGRMEAHRGWYEEPGRESSFWTCKV